MEEREHPEEIRASVPETRDSNPGRSLCAQELHLTEAFTQAVHEVMELHDRQFAALTTGESGLDRFDLALQQAKRKRERLKTEYLLHLMEHGC